MFIILTASRHTYFKQIYGFVLPRKLLHSTAHVAFASRHNSSNSRRRRKKIEGGRGLVLQRILCNILWMISHLSFSDEVRQHKQQCLLWFLWCLRGWSSQWLFRWWMIEKERNTALFEMHVCKIYFCIHGDAWLLGTSKVPGSRPWAPALDKSGSTACRMLMTYIYV